MTKKWIDCCKAIIDDPYIKAARLKGDLIMGEQTVHFLELGLPDGRMVLECGENDMYLHFVEDNTPSRKTALSMANHVEFIVNSVMQMIFKVITVFHCILSFVCSQCYLLDPVRVFVWRAQA